MKLLPYRKSPRLPGYDYSQAGAYFVTICTDQRRLLFGQIDNEEMYLNPLGQIAVDCWREIPTHYLNVRLDTYVVMPNHLHGIIYLNENTSPFQTILGRVINAYKGATTTRIRQTFDTEILVWQGRYHDHIIRDEADLLRIQTYIQNNPAQWATDTFYITE